ncbi:MAG: hypothetical protein LBF97_02040 [Elusimicrobiota bacterium]|jgi:DNA-binding cell septation regulator SpoVG|nr:hypothetical protein [Elusimicrobiota bacterium]
MKLIKIFRNINIFTFLTFLIFLIFLISYDTFVVFAETKKIENTEQKEYKITNMISIDFENYKKIRLILNNYFVIEGIKFYSDGTIEFPYYLAKNKIKYISIIFIDKNLERHILDIIKKEKYLENNFEFNTESVNFEVKKITKLETKGTRLANVDLLIDNKFIIVLGIMAGKKGKNKWIAYPAEKIDNYYHNQIYFLNQKLKDRIEKNILEKYEKQDF